MIAVWAMERCWACAGVSSGANPRPRRARAARVGDVHHTDLARRSEDEAGGSWAEPGDRLLSTGRDLPRKFSTAGAFRAPMTQLRKM